MSRQRHIDRADQRLAEQLKNSGIEISVRQVERMRTFGLLPSVEGRGPDRRFPAGTDSRAIEIHELRTAGLSLAEIATILFFRGYDISLEVLRKSYSAVHQSGLQALKRASESDDPFDIAEAAGSRLASQSARSRRGKEWKERLSRRDESARSLYQSVHIVMLWTFLLGRFPYEGLQMEEAMREFVDASGLRAMETEKIGDLGPLTDSLPMGELADVFNLLNAETLEQVLSDSTLNDLTTARDGVKSVMLFSEAITDFLEHIADSQEAMGFAAMGFGADEQTLAMLVPWFRVMDHSIEGLVDDSQTESLREMAHILSAQSNVLDALPRKFWQLVPRGEEALSGLSANERVELRQALEAFASDHPDQLALALSETEE